MSDSFNYVDGAATPAFAHMCRVLANALGARVEEDQIRLHAKLLGDIPIEELRFAFGTAARELERGFYPTPGQLRKYVRPTSEDAALLAWTAFGRAAEEAGSWASLTVDDGAAAAALEAVFGSWPAFCEYEEGPALGQKRSEFMAAYRDARRRDTGQRRLAGGCESGSSGPAGETAGLIWQARITEGCQVVLGRAEPQGVPGRGSRLTAGERESQGPEGRTPERTKGG